MLKGGKYILGKFYHLYLQQLQDNPKSPILPFQITITLSTLFIITTIGLTFLDLVLPFKWFESKVNDICQNLFTFLKEMWPLSNVSIISLKVSLVHLPCWVKVRTLFFSYQIFCFCCNYRWSTIGANSSSLLAWWCPSHFSSFNEKTWFLRHEIVMNSCQTLR